jgi:AcrR family transcriptional regulator
MHTPTSADAEAKRAGKSREANRVIAGAAKHFFAHGFRGVTMDDLATELRMSKKTFYAHFSGKAALLAAVLDDKLNRVEADLARVMDDQSDGDFPGRLQSLLACLQKHTEEIQPAFVRDVRREDPELFARVQERRRKLIHHFFGQLLEEGRRAGMMRQDIPVAMLIEILVGAVDAIMHPARVEELGLTVKAGFALIISVFLEGVLIRQGGETHP